MANRVLLSEFFDAPRGTVPCWRDPIDPTGAAEPDRSELLRRVRAYARRALVAVCAALMAWNCATRTAAAIAPYQVDSVTLHLWHFDEPPGATNLSNAVPGGVALLAVGNGATTGEASLPGFGAAVSTYDAGPTATLAANPNGYPGRDAYIGPLPLANGAADNVLLTCTGPGGAFTFEALVFVAFVPTNLAVSPDSTRSMQILSADADDGETRVFQFRLHWPGVNTFPRLQFINIGWPVQTLEAQLPLSGSNAIAVSNWYHVAVTYNGQPNTAQNTKFYWTKVEPSRTQADLLASFCMTNALPVGAADWVIGNEGRSTFGTTDNLVGLIDEVRISSVARGPDEFVFKPQNPDADGDDLPDEWELNWFGSLSWSSADDPDRDGATNFEEYLAGSNPADTRSTPTDTDADELPDAWEFAHFAGLGWGPNDDPDADGFSNFQEYSAGTNPANSASNPLDSEGDSLPDTWELAFFGTLNFQPGDDPDGDGFSNAAELQWRTLPNVASNYPPGPQVKFVPVEDGDPNTSEFGYAGASSINAVAFIKSALMTVSNQQFIAYYGRHATDPNYAYNNKIVVARRRIDTNIWEVFRTAFAPNNIEDGHDVVCFGIDGDGFMHISWGMHGDAFHYARSTNPVTGSHPIGFGPDTTMTGQESTATYPQFLSLPNGDLLYLYRKGWAGSGDYYINRYSRITRTWTNVHRSGNVAVPFIKGTGWRPDYSPYLNMPCVDTLGNIYLVWTWRYQNDSPARESGYQTNHDFNYARSGDGGLSWQRQNGTSYTLPINERGENGNTNSIAERVLAIPEGYSLINQAGMCLDMDGTPVIATWWAPGTATNNFRRQYMVAFPGPNRFWEVRQVSWRTNDPPNVKYSETYVRDLGRPVVVCDRQDRIIVVYRDNFRSNGLTIVHSLPKSVDPARTNWIEFDLTTDNLGSYEPVIDLERWLMDNQLHILYQPAQGLGYVPPTNTAAQIGVLEWDAAQYFAHRPSLNMRLVNNGRDIAFWWATQPGWGYRLQTSTNLLSWESVAMFNSSGWAAHFIHTNGVDVLCRFWRLELREGGFRQ
ncbi:MAG: BNR-4 repeat-containing protein [Verrucomicrobiales bacterium]|nr:BNR-4 repeat-containing protein [Verrucomicrobiales bacterium]